MYSPLVSSLSYHPPFSPDSLASQNGQRGDNHVHR